MLWRKYLHLPLHLQSGTGYSWVQFSHPITSNSLWTNGLQHARLPCPSPTPGPYSNSCPLSQWCHPTILSSVSLVSSCLPSFPASGCFLVSQLFASGGQTIRVSASASALPKDIKDWFPRDVQESSPNHSSKASILRHSASLQSNSHIHTWLLEKP